VEIKIEGLAALVKKFEEMPEKVTQKMRAELKTATRDIREYARDHHRFTTRGGDTEKRGIASKVDGLSLVGRVYLATDVAVYQHEGTGLYGPRHKAITIKPKLGKALRWVSRRDVFMGSLGSHGFSFAKKVVNPGIKPDPYLYNAAEVMRPRIISRFEALVKKIIEE
jgi:hypothetical protein